MRLGWLVVGCCASMAVACSKGTTAKAPDPGPAKSAEAKPATPAPEWWTSSVAVVNDSDWTFFQLYLTPHEATTWGDDLLGDQVLSKGQKATIKGLDCGTFDIKLVDHESHECVVQDVNLCVEDMRWVVNNDELVTCNVLTAETGKGN